MMLLFPLFFSFIVTLALCRPTHHNFNPTGLSPAWSLDKLCDVPQSGLSLPAAATPGLPSTRLQALAPDLISAARSILAEHLSYRVAAPCLSLRDGMRICTQNVSPFEDR